MPLLIFPALLILAIAFVPVLFFLRFRLGSVRRRARPWVAKVNVVVLTISAGLLLTSASIVNLWVPNALKFVLGGMVVGSLLSIFGLGFTQWERTPQGLFYRPNRWFALLIPLALTLRLIYWLWRLWHGWSASADTKSWLAASGTAGSLAIAAVVAGYYFGYAIGVWKRSARPRSLPEKLDDRGELRG